jgi:hypothetical protein
MNEKMGRLYTKMGNREESVKCYKAIADRFPDMEADYAKYIW